VETDNPPDVLRDVAKFEPSIRYEVYPVVDIQEVVAIGAEAVAFRASIAWAASVRAGPAS